MVNLHVSHVCVSTHTCVCLLLFMSGQAEDQKQALVHRFVVVVVLSGQGRLGLRHLLRLVSAPVAFVLSWINHHTKLLAHVGHLI